MSRGTPLPVLLPRSLISLFRRGVIVDKELVEPELAASADYCAQLSSAVFADADRRIMARLRQHMQTGSLPDTPLEGLNPGNEPDWADHFPTALLNVLAQTPLKDGPAAICALSLRELARVPRLGPGGLLAILRTIEGLAPADGASPGEDPSLPPLPYAADIKREDLRFGWIVKTLSDSAADLGEALRLRARQDWGHPSLGNARSGIAMLSAAAQFSVAEEIRAVGHELAKRCFVARQRGRNADLFALRYGVAGDNLSTLQEIGDHYGVTRERARQITDRVLRAQQGRSIWSPATQRLASEMERLLPCPETRLNEELRPLLGEALQVRGAWRFANQVLGRPFPLSFEDLPQYIQHAPIAVHPKESGTSWIMAAMNISHRMISYVGAAQAHWVAAEVGRTTRKPIKIQDLLRVLAARDSFAWLDEPGGWYWFGADETANRILNYARKIAAVALRQVDVDEFYGGIARLSRDFRAEHSSGIAITPRVLNAMLGATSWLHRKQGNDYVPADPLDPKAILSDSEFRIYEALKERGGLASRISLRRRFVDRRRNAMKAITFSVAIDTSPIFRQIDRGIFALRGWPINARSLAKSKRQVGLARDVTRSVTRPVKNGVACFEVVLTAGSIRNRQHSLPVNVAREVPEGTYALGDEGQRLRVLGGVLRGAATYALRKGWRESSRIAVRLDIEAKTASLGLVRTA